MKGQRCLEGEDSLTSAAFSGVSGHLRDAREGPTSDHNHDVANYFDGPSVTGLSRGLSSQRVQAGAFRCHSSASMS